MIVADVNLVAYLLISGEHTDEAGAVLRKDAVWSLPYLWRSEFRNILAMCIQHRSMSLKDASLIWDSAASLTRHHEYSVDAQAILGLVARQPLAAYDAEYVALAHHLGVPLVTFDRKLQAAVPDAAISVKAFLRKGQKPGW
jgi:predicted nucleic acid-binding protein